MARIKSRARTGVLAGAAAVAVLAFPAIASANVTATRNGTEVTITSDAADAITVKCIAGNIDPSPAMPIDCDDVTKITVVGDAGANTIDLSGVTAAAFSKNPTVTVDGKGGIDTITGSEFGDRLTGDKQNDTVNGGPGNDTIVWNGGDGDDVNNGQDGTDTIEVNGSPVAGETFTVKPSATPARVQFDRAAPTPTPPGLFNLDIGTSEVLDLRMNGGDDTLTADAGLAALGFTVHADGGAGADTIDGSDAADILKGGADNDTITPDDNPLGTRDVANGDAGNDLIIWNGGDDDDINDGGDGVDTSRVNGSPVAGETFTVKPGANGHVIFDRAAPTPNPPGLFNIDMSTTEVLDLKMNGGDDSVTADNGIAPLSLNVDGGDGVDSIDGGDGADTLNGGNDSDTIVPDDNPAGTRDVANGDAGDDTIIWNGGDDDDVNNGGDGDDTSVVNGATAAERFTIKPSATPGRVQFDRTSQNPAPFNIDIGSTELLRLNANDGNDTLLGSAGLAGLIETELNGEGGNDGIRGTDAEDRLNGGKGHDAINSRDKAEDLVDCGSGLDIAQVDRRDFLRGCNLVLGGHLRVRVTDKVLDAANGVAALPLKCVGTKRCKGTVRLRSNGKTLATSKFNITKRSKTVHLHLNRRGLRKLDAAPAKGIKASLQITAHDARGNGWRSTTRLRLKG